MSLLGGLAKGLVSMIPVVGPGIASRIDMSAPKAPPPPTLPQFGGFAGASVGAALGPFSIQGQVGKTQTTTYSGGVAVSPGAGGACPKGYHLNKNPLAASKRHGAVPARSICVRNRHMNPMNGRAVSRAARRIHRGEKLLRRIFSVQGKAHGKIKPKGKGR